MVEQGKHTLGRYEAKGNQVWRLGSETQHQDGSTSFSLSFPLLTVEDYCTGNDNLTAAEAVAGLMNQGERAPQMLEALKEYLDWHESQFMLPSGNFEDPDQHELAKNARAALASAQPEPEEAAKP